MNRRFHPAIVCSKCGDIVSGDITTDTDFRRSYLGWDVCVSCYVTLKRRNSEYGDDEPDPDSRLVSACPECDSARIARPGHCTECKSDFDIPVWRETKDHQGQDNRRGLAGKLDEAAPDEVSAGD